ncbi:protein phosphatase 1 regulatory subunit 42-like [Sitophilus oryzae]|uniref:Protein phosphatase 1 regulatory subunit 42-like n=1 Tax=Sitophilus oryzae TaxID=7048 RepID=A0A6J2YSG4_SITOR|nr:protein phosphatase 1 regulatory subunit 42-like [Sitophilus oryzae]
MNTTDIYIMVNPKQDALPNKKDNPVKKRRSTIFNKVTHLYLQEKSLVKIPTLSCSQDIQTLYLYDNALTTIDNLNNLTGLQNLYLQNNKIERIENMSGLNQLKKLYIGKNKISVLEGLESLEQLEELHIEKQDIPKKMPFCFDPRTILTLAETLRILNIASNQIDSLKSLSPLRCLEVLDASNNNIEDVKDIVETIRTWYSIRDLKFIGNPVTKKHRYKEDIIANVHRLEIIDNKNITDTTRSFLKRFEEGKTIYGLKPNVNLAEIMPGLPKNYSATLQKAASASIIKESRCKLLDDIAAFDVAEPAYLTWNMFPKRKQFTKPSQSQLKGHKMESQKNILIKRSSLTQRRNT